MVDTYRKMSQSRGFPSIMWVALIQSAERSSEQSQISTRRRDSAAVSCRLSPRPALRFQTGSCPRVLKISLSPSLSRSPSVSPPISISSSVYFSVSSLYLSLYLYLHLSLFLSLYPVSVISPLPGSDSLENLTDTGSYLQCLRLGVRR